MGRWDHFQAVIRKIQKVLLFQGCCWIHSECWKVWSKCKSNKKSCQQGWTENGLRGQVLWNFYFLRLQFNRYEDRTVYHDFYTQFGHSKIFVQQQPPGYGIKAHRAIKAICQMCGIKVRLNLTQFNYYISHPGSVRQVRGQLERAKRGEGFRPGTSPAAHPSGPC